VPDRQEYRFSHRIRVGFDETDAQGVVYYGRYMPYFDRARVEYLRRIGQLTHVPGAPEFVMRAQHVEYHAPARFDDEVEVFVRVKELGRTSVTWAFDAYRADTGEYLTSSGPYIGRTIRDDFWLFGVGPRTVGNIPPTEATR